MTIWLGAEVSQRPTHSSRATVKRPDRLAGALGLLVRQYPDNEEDDCRSGGKQELAATRRRANVDSLS